MKMGVHWGRPGSALYVWSYMEKVGLFLQNLQKSHQERKNVKKDNRENFIGLIMLLTEGKSQEAIFTLDGWKYDTIEK